MHLQKHFKLKAKYPLILLLSMHLVAFSLNGGLYFGIYSLQGQMINTQKLQQPTLRLKLPRLENHKGNNIRNLSRSHHNNICSRCNRCYIRGILNSSSKEMEETMFL